MFRLLLSCLAVGGLFLTSPAAMAETALVVSKAVEIPQRWLPEQHLYVKGGVGLSTERLGALETWLDAHAPHWTVVLMNHASGESWQDASGHWKTGMEAVEYALGQQLPAETAFGKHTHPTTGERDGAWLVIFLEERQFSYWASDAYDRRRLGEDRWQGNLDSAARQAMRGGGRIGDAVQDTITSIDGELKRRITGEAEARRQEAERLERLRSRTAQVIGETRQAIARTTVQAVETRRNWPLATGPLTNPPVDRWLASLAEAEALLAAGPLTEAPGAPENVRAEVEAWDIAASAYQAAPARFRTLLQELDAMALHPWSGAARAGLIAARELLREATAAHATGDAGYSNTFGQALTNLGSARTSDAATHRLAAEHARLSTWAASAPYPNPSPAADLAARARGALGAFPGQREAGADGEALLREADQALTKAQLTAEAAIRRARDLRRAGGIGGAAGAGALILTGWVGHRRRRRVKDPATVVFQQWEEALKNKTTELFALLDKAGSTVGNAAMLERSGWSGTTRDLAFGAIRDVDQLFVMSSALDQVLEQARKLIQPDNPLAAGRNLVSGGQYRKALDLLEADHIRFGPESTIPSILASAPDRPWRGLLGRREDCEPFTLTFSGLNGAFNERAARAVAALDRVGTAWSRMGDALTGLEDRLDDAVRLEKEVNAAEATDRRFGMDPVFASLIPAARADWAAAAELGVADPVQALDGPWAEGSRKTDDAAALCQAVLGFRAASLPAIQQNETTLTAAGRQTGWIGATLDDLSQTAETLSATAVSRSISQDLAAWQTAALALRDRTLESVAQQERATSSSLPALAALDTRIEAERVRLAALLGISPDHILTESGRNPSTGLAAARGSHEAALTELDRGDPAAARSSLDEAAALMTASGQLVDQAIQSHDAHKARMQSLTAESARLSALLPEHAAILDSLCQGWAPAALHPFAADPSYPDPGESVSDNLRRAEDLLASALDRTKAGDEACHRGALLAAMDCHREAASGQTAAAAQLQAIVQQRDAITAATRTNAAESERLTRFRSNLQSRAEEPVTMVPTRTLLRSVSADLDAALAAAAATGLAANPFAAADALATCQAGLAALEHRLQHDRERFAEASRSVAHAQRQLSTALPMIRQAAQDNIPDSTTTAQARTSLGQLEEALVSVTQALQQPHGDWNECDRAADQIAADAATWQARLQGELQRAAASVEALQRAAQLVRSAGGWSGALGVRITGIPGQGRLEQAREALNQGDYDTATRAAEAAHREAQQAIAAAEAEQRRRRQEQERQEESRRRAAAPRRAASASSFGSSFGSSSSGSSFGGSSRSSSSGSSSSRSSFSSGSGAARSGW